MASTAPPSAMAASSVPLPNLDLPSLAESDAPTDTRSRSEKAGCKTASELDPSSSPSARTRTTEGIFQHTLVQTDTPDGEATRYLNLFRDGTCVWGFTSSRHQIPQLVEGRLEKNEVVLREYRNKKSIARLRLRITNAGQELDGAYGVSKATAKRAQFKEAQLDDTTGIPSAPVRDDFVQYKTQDTPVDTHVIALGSIKNETLQARLLRSTMYEIDVYPGEGPRGTFPRDAMLAGPGCTGISYEVHHNDGGVLSFTTSTDFLGAYSSTNARTFAISLHTGEPFHAKEAFQSQKITPLAKQLWARFQRRLADRKKEVAAQEKAMPAGDQNGLEILSDASATVTFDNAVQALDTMKVAKKGVSFELGVSLAHCCEALSPERWFFFSWAELAPYLRDDGPLPPR